MVKLSTLPANEKLVVEHYGNSEPLLTDAASFIEDYLYDPDEEYAGVYRAAENPAKFDMDDVREIVQRAYEYMGQYDDWEDDMMEEIKASPIAKEFLSYLNKLARKFMSYEFGEEVEVDIGRA